MEMTFSTDLHEAAKRSDGVTGTWTESEIENAIQRYSKFLALIAEKPGRAVAPTKEIDEIWHLHMLSPRAYANDCHRLFGDLLDHNGGFGKGEGELPELIRVFEDTAARWEAKFDEPYVRFSQQEEIKKCWHDCQGRCWHACSNGVASTEAA